jgi:hypothetical protein
MIGTELHVQASVWKRCRVRERSRRAPARRAVVGPPGPVHAGGWHALDRFRGHWSQDTDLAVLVMEGEAADRTNGGAAVEDALYEAALARGLALTTDLDHLDLRPLPGWRVVVDGTGALTVEWPHAHPLLDAAPVDLPSGWLDAVTALRLVVVVAGHGLGLSAPTAGLLAPRLANAAMAGALAAGAVDSTLPTANGMDGDGQDNRLT